MPGLEAHIQMKPRLADGSPINIKHPTPPKEGAVLILLNNLGGKAHFPLIQRPMYEGVHSGQIALPGGKVEPSDTNLYQTALRETEEEIGVDRGAIEVVGSLSAFYVAASNFNVLPVIGKIDATPKFAPDSREVEAIINPAIEDLMDASKAKTKEIEARGGMKLWCPYFDLGGKVVWGATAMMLSEFKAILGESGTKVTNA